MLELVLVDAALAVGFGFGGAVGVDRFFGKVVCSCPRDDEGAPAVAVGF